MAKACEECIQGTIHEGQPTGKIEKIHGLDTYVTGNTTNPKAVVVMYSDIFSHALPNNRLLADAYGRNGDWLVYFPDFFEGDPVQLKVADVLIPADTTKQSTFAKYTGILGMMPSFVMWMTRHKFAHTDEICTTFLEKLRRATPLNQKIGMVGQCWGGKYAIRAGLEGKMIEIDGQKVPLVNAAAAMHPSHLTIPDDVETLVVPVSIGWGVEDQGVSYETRAKFEKASEDARKSGRKVPEMEHRDYRPGRHGFSIRGNPDDPQEKKCLEDSLTQVVDWFKKYL